MDKPLVTPHEKVLDMRILLALKKHGAQTTRSLTNNLKGGHGKDFDEDSVECSLKILRLRKFATESVYKGSRRHDLSNGMCEVIDQQMKQYPEQWKHICGHSTSKSKKAGKPVTKSKKTDKPANYAQHAFA